jgi:DNA adenine methylase
MKPFIKYTGSKFPYLAEIKPLLPSAYGSVLIPFMGGGSFISLFKYKNVFASDLNQDVVNVFNCLMSDLDTLKLAYNERHLALLSAANKDKYYRSIRARFNVTKSPEDFLFLTRTCFNGLIRYNKAGDFNVGFMHNRNGINPTTLSKIMQSWQHLFSINTVSFTAESYKLTAARARAEDLVIADPPYINTKGQYQSGKFDFDEFETVFNDLTKKNVKWLITLDDNTDLVKSRLPNLTGFYHKTTVKGSSLSGLQGNKVKKGNTIITNYQK